MCDGWLVESPWGDFVVEYSINGLGICVCVCLLGCGVVEESPWRDLIWVIV